MSSYAVDAAGGVVVIANANANANAATGVVDW
jgi:hypothetical protein